MQANFVFLRRNYAARLHLLLLALMLTLANTCVACQNPTPRNPDFPTSDAVFSEVDYFAPSRTGISTTPTSGRPKGVPIGLEGQWILDSEFGLSTYDANFKIPLLFGRNSSTPSGPPPIVNFGFGYTDLFLADNIDSVTLPSTLYESSVGLAWMRRLNERWMFRTMIGVGFATDGENTTSDAWRFRGGAFAICQANEKWQWTFGAIALGRDDLPVVPAVGAVWTPQPGTRIDLTLPRPGINQLLSDDGQRQRWAYLGVGLNGNTWGYEGPEFGDDTLTYSDWRAVAGWESKPTPPPGIPFAPGRKYVVEAGYVFSRDLEFDRQTVELALESAWMIRLSTSF